MKDVKDLLVVGFVFAGLILVALPTLQAMYSGPSDLSPELHAQEIHDLEMHPDYVPLTKAARGADMAAS